MKSYAEFLQSKRRRIADAGFQAEILNPALYDFQMAVTRRALRRGRYCIFAGCGLGKTIMQLEWAEQVAASRGPVLILTPLAVAQQTEREAERFGYQARYARSQESAQPIAITNYQKLERFDPGYYAGIGSEGVESLRWGRRFLEIELKRSYYDVAIKNLRNVEIEKNQGELFK